MLPFPDESSFDETTVHIKVGSAVKKPRSSSKGFQQGRLDNQPAVPISPAQRPPTCCVRTAQVGSSATTRATVLVRLSARFVVGTGQTTPRGFCRFTLRTASTVPLSQSHPINNRKLMSNPFRGASGSGEQVRLNPSFDVSNNPQRWYRGG